MSKGEQRGWAVAMVDEWGNYYILISTIRELRREAIEAYDEIYGARGTYSKHRRRWEVCAQRVIVRLADEAER